MIQRQCLQSFFNLGAVGAPPFRFKLSHARTNGLEAALGDLCPHKMFLAQGNNDMKNYFKIIQMKDPNDPSISILCMATSSRRGHFDESSKPLKHTIFEAANLLDAALENKPSAQLSVQHPRGSRRRKLGIRLKICFWI